MGGVEGLVGYRMAVNGMPAGKLTGTYLKVACIVLDVIRIILRGLLYNICIV